MEKKILIVNYQPRKLEQWKTLFNDIEGELLTATNGEDALKIFEENQPDIIVIDPMLPKKSGFDVIKEIKDKKPDTKVVVVASVHKGVKYQTLAKNTYRVEEFVEEPIDDNVLKEKVARVVGFSVDSMVLEELMEDNTEQKAEEKKKPEPKLNFEETVKPKKKKSSTKKRFEEIIEETLSGKIVDDLPGKKIKKPKIEEGEKVFTSEELFSDVINEVEESFIDQTLESLVDEGGEQKAKKDLDSVEAEIEQKLEKTLSGLKVDKKKKHKKAVIETKPKAVKKEEKPAEEIKKEDKKEAKGKKEKGTEYGNYLLLEKVATGGMAELFKAKRRGVQGFQKIVAIKRILPHLVENEEFVTMFIDEAKLAAQLNHPNIAQIYDLGKIEDTFYIAMEYVEGHDLRKILKKCKEKGCYIPEPIVLFVASKVLSALDYAHRKKGLDNKDLHIVHRDISPQNIILSLEGDVKLVDFGIAKAATKASQTQAGALKGKLLYMSPEQAWGEAVDKRSDLFSLGSVMYEALTGKKCFLADSEINILEKVRNVDYVPIREVNPRVSEKTARIIEKALTKDKKKRYQSAKEMEQDILDVLNSLPYTVNERTVAEFINALYKDDLKKINEMAEKLVVESPKEKVEEKPVEQKVEEDIPVEEYSISESDIDSEDFEEIPDRRANTGTIVVPNPEDLEKYEKEELEKLEKEEKSNKMVLIIGAIVALLLVGIIGYFVSTKKKVEKPAPKTQIAQKNEPDTAKGEANPSENKPAGEGQEQNAQTQTQPSENAQKVLPDIEKQKQKMVEELTKKKIAEQKKKLEKQLAAQRKLIEEKKKKLAEAKKKAAVTPKPKPKKTVKNKPAPKKENKPANNVTENNANKVSPPVNENTSKETKVTEQAPTEQQTQPEPQPQPEKTQVEQPKETVQQPEKKTTITETPTPAEVQQPEVKEGDLVPLTDDVVKPVPVKKVKPKYTLAAKRKRVHGTIIAQALIDENGNVVEVRVLRKMSRPYGLDKEVMKALKKWKFEPATKNGVRVKVYDTFVFKF